ncbi:MAG TPA: response regulator [Thermoanaerobaculia bacterium]|nr:response regulator [Thermoanaerobaculia bacterium]
MWPSFRKKRALVLDDDASMRRLITKILQKEGFAVDAVTSGADAIKHLQGESDYSVILLDIMMPLEGGLTVVKEMRQSHAELLKRAIVVSGTSSRSIIDGIRDEIFDFVSKPFEPEELLVVVRRCVEKA